MTTLIVTSITKRQARLLVETANKITVRKDGSVMVVQRDGRRIIPADSQPAEMVRSVIPA